MHTQIHTHTPSCKHDYDYTEILSRFYLANYTIILALCRILAPGNDEPKQERKIAANGANDDGHEP